MNKKRLAARLPSPAMVVATAALFVAIGGTSYAAFSLRANTVGTKQLKNGAVTSGKLKNRAVTKAKLNLAGVTIPNARYAGTAASATNAGNASHARTADTATNAATASNADKLGGSSPSAYLRYGATLPSGATETGLWGYRNNAALGYGAVAAGAGAVGAVGAGGGPFVSFATPLAAPLDAAHTVYVPGGSAAHCPGVGQADPGYLCVYQQDILNAVTPDSTNIFKVEAGGPAGSGTQGFSIFLMAAGAGDWLVGGTYAVTAP
jgi:hypothetical protein